MNDGASTRRDTASDPNSGHRKRLRERFAKSGLAGFSDYEVVEMLLTLTTPQRDCKPAAKAALDRFGTLRGVLEAPRDELKKVKGIGEVNSFGIRLVQEVAREFLKQRLIERPVFNSAEAIFDYLYHSMRDLKIEVFKVFYLNAQNEVTDSEDLFHGTVNSSAVWVREVMAKALQHAATGLIFVHNHPSGNPHPSDADESITRELVYAGRIMQVKVVDHLIIGENRYFSFAGAGLIDGYDSSYTELKMTSAQQKCDSVSGDITSGVPWQAKPTIK